MSPRISLSPVHSYTSGLNITLYDLLQVGKGLKFNNSNDYVLLDIGGPQCWEMPLNCTNGFSYCLWVQMNMECNILGSRRSSGTKGFRLAYDDGKMKSRVWENDRRYGSQPPFTSTAWEHICSTWNPTVVKVYRNGNLQVTSSDSSDTTTGPGDSKIVLGAHYTDPPNTNSRDFVMDEFAFWHRDELSAVEIQDLYNSYFI